MSTHWARGRLAIVTASSEVNYWASGRAILSGLERMYREAFGSKAEFFRCPPSMAGGEARLLAERIRGAQPDCVVFLTFQPHPGEVLEPLLELYPDGRLPPLVAHAHGDFTSNIPPWLRCEGILKKTHVRFVCGSEAHRELVATLLDISADSVSLCPFPVDGEVFFSDPELRRSARARLGLEEDELAILYSGRISLQKNPVHLVSEFLDFSSQGRKAKLFLAGVIDCIDAPHFGIEPLPGDFQYRQWHAFMDSLPAGKRELVQFLGMQGPGNLAALYNASDVCFSLSLHHDEDFGMAPLEALCSGAVCVLTGWGGYKSFALSEERARDAVSLVPVILEYEGLRVSHSSIQEALLRQSQVDQSPAARQARARIYQERFSVSSLSTRLKEVFQQAPPEFNGFGPLTKRFVRAFDQAAPFPAGPEQGGAYETIYRSYFCGEQEGTSVDPRDLKSKQWLEANIQSRAARPRPKRTPELTSYFDFLGVAGLDRVSPMNPIFLVEHEDPGILNSGRLWMARDGLIPLLWYFHNHPQPHPEFLGEILVHERLAPFVPESWRAHAGAFRVLSTVSRPYPERRKFMLTLIIEGSQASMEWLEARLKRAVQVLGADVLARSEIVACFANRLAGKNHVAEYLSRISDAFGQRVREAAWSEFGAGEEVRDLEIIDLNDMILCADNFIVSCMQGLGARLVDLDHAATGADPLGSAHTAIISLPLRSECVLPLSELEFAADSDGNNLPWPRKFAEWALSHACRLAPNG